MSKALQSVAKVLGALALMTACGLMAFVGAIAFLMNWGLKLHGNYEYYAHSLCGTLFIFGSGAIGFLAPGFILWRLHKQNMQFSLRTVFIVATVVAILLGVYALSL